MSEGKGSAPPTPARSSAAALRERLSNQIDKLAPEKSTAAAASADEDLERARLERHLLKVITYILAGAFGLVVLAYVVMHVWPGSGAAEGPGTAGLLEILKIGVLPALTTIIGFITGRRR